MSERIFPASPNWYNSKVSDANEHGTFVFGARHTVYIYKIESGLLKHVGVFTDHRDRVSCVCLHPQSDKPPLCVSAADDGKVKLWDIPTRTLQQEHAQHDVKISAVSWSPLDGDIVVSGDEKGHLVSWYLTDNRTLVFVPESGQAIMSLACSTMDTLTVAVGYKSGLILLVSLVNKGKIIHRLRGHDDEVQSLSWSCFPGEDFKGVTPGKENDNEEFVNKEIDSAGCMLVSGCKSRTVGVWSTLTGKSLQMLKLPMNTGYRRERWDEQGRGRIWVAVCWPKHSRTQFISSSYNGDILMWDLWKAGRQKWQLFSTGGGAGHSRIVFNISCGGRGHQSLLTISMDRQVVLWDVESVCSVTSVSTLGGFVYAAKSSPVDPGLVAVGVGDNLIRVWNTADSNKPNSATSLWQGIKSKVTALSWHPSREGLLAYGTEDGRVGIYDVLSNKAPDLSSTYHKKTVYVVTWGPTCPQTDNTSSMSVYSVGDGVIKGHNPRKMEKEAVDLHRLIATTNDIKSKFPIRSEISWKPDFTAVAVGNDDGSVELFSPPDFRLVCVIRLHQKLVNCVQWHPPFTAASPTVSPCRHWVATGSNENVVYVVDLKQLFEVSHDTAEVVTITSCIRQLTGHTGRITGLSWSPHDDGQLVSASYDGTAQVWDVMNNEPVANYRGHLGKLLCAEWSPVEADLVMTGADDFMLRLWRISQQEHKTCPAAKRKSKGKSRSRPKSTKDVVGKEANDEGLEELTETVLSQEVEDLLEAKRRQLLVTNDVHSISPNHNPVEGEVCGAVETEIVLSTKYEETVETVSLPLTVQDILGYDDLLDSDEGTEQNDDKASQSKGPSTSGRSREIRKKRRPKSMFPVLSSRENRNRAQIHADLLTLLKIVCDGSEIGEEEDSLHLGLYLSRRVVYRCLRREGQYHLDHGNMDYYLQLEIWKGNIGGALKVAREREDLSDWLVAMAPMASHQTWLQACEDYALQLESDGQFHKAATYYLAAHKVYDAINLFKRHRMFKEAVALAKLRLSPIDHIHEELYTAWGLQLTKDGHFEQAAKCYVAIKQVREAAKLLVRRNDLQSLRTAAHMNFLANERHEGLIYAQKVIHHHLLDGDWAKVHEFCEDNKQLKVFVLLACLHELILQELPAVYTGSETLSGGATFTGLGEHSTEDGMAAKLPEFIVDMSDTDIMSPWKPHLVGKHTLPHHILRLWCTRFGVTMDTNDLEDLCKTLKMVHQVQGHVDTQQLLIQGCYDLTLALLHFLLADTPSAIKHLLGAVAVLHNARHHKLMQAVCRLFLPLGPKYALKLQHEVTALSVMMSIENCNPYNGTLKSHTVKKYWSEPKEDDLVSSSAHRCRELDCLRAYYYLAVLYHLQEMFGALQTDDAEKTGDFPHGTQLQTCTTQKENCEPGSNVINECPINKTSSSKLEAQELVGESVPKDEVDRVLDAGLHGNSELVGAVHSVTNQEECDNKDISKGKESENQSNACEIDVSTFIRENRSIEESKSTSETHIDSSEKRDEDTAIVSSTTQELSPSAMSQDCVLSRSIEHNDSNQVGGACVDSSSHSSNVCDRMEPHSQLCNVTLSKLQYLSKCVLWDIQAKRYALTETLGYVHRAMSQILLHEKQTKKEQPQNGQSQSKVDLPDESTYMIRGGSSGDSVSTLTGENSKHSLNTITGNNFTMPIVVDIHSSAQDSANNGAHVDSLSRCSTAIPNRTEPTNCVAKSTQNGGNIPSDVIFGLPDSAMNIAGVDNYVSISDLWKCPTLDPDAHMPSVFQEYVKPKKVLWKDDHTSAANSSGERTDHVPGRRSSEFLCRHHHQSSVVPGDWYNLPVDEKYSKTYMTLAMLQDEEEGINGELARGLESDQTLFPNPLGVADKLLDVCDKCSGLTKDEKAWFCGKVVDWALVFSVTSHDRELFREWRKKMQPI